MDTRDWDWNGARWWRVDLHAHSPASADYGKGPDQAQLRKRTPKEWLLDYMRAGIDCVAITDHNSGTWADQLRTALDGLKRESHADFRPLWLFPGVELSVNGGVHLLVILDSSRTTSDIDSLLGAVGFSETKGESDAVTSKSLVEVVAEVEKLRGIAIPAHVDRECGIFHRLSGTTLRQALTCKGVFAQEVVDPSTQAPAMVAEEDVRWTPIVGSDSHHPSGNSGQRYPGSRFTWVKMGSPSLEGLHLALLDGPLSVRRSDQQAGDPNEHAPFVVEAIEVTHAKYMGRAESFTLKLNPWLNAIVGGRGTGKSTLVEFLRLALRRDGDLPTELTQEFEKYRTVYSDRDDAGLLTPAAEIRVIYRREGARFRLQWSPNGDLDAIEEEREGSWRPAEGDIQQRFPARIYSQKEVFQLAKTPLALLRVVDKAPQVGHSSWSKNWEEESKRYLSHRARVRAIEVGLAEGPRFRGELDDVKRKLAVYETTGDAGILKEFQRRIRQRRALETWEVGWASAGERLRTIAADLVPDPLDAGSFDLTATEDAEFHAAALSARERMEGIRREVENLAALADRSGADWRAARDESAWHGRVDAAVKGYEQLRSRFAEGAAGDPAEYGELVQRRHALERNLDELDGRKKQVEELREQAAASLVRLLNLRRGLTESRRAFLAEILKGNRYVRIDVVPYGARDLAESDLRRLLQLEDGRFEKDVDSQMERLYDNSADPVSVESALDGIKQELRAIAEARLEPTALGDRRFGSHLAKLPPEALDRIDFWFPEDFLDVQYSTTSDGQSFRSIQEGLPGQKTAALLAFLLSYGDEPLVLDQPEDDLDNHLIYDLIVTQLREVKPHRQLIVVTHNPNIVVNGDAELVVALVARAGQTQKECEGSLQEQSVRNVICKVMEGGRVAFDERYRRIALEGRRHV